MHWILVVIVMYMDFLDTEPTSKDTLNSSQQLTVETIRIDQSKMYIRHEWPLMYIFLLYNYKAYQQG